MTAGGPPPLPGLTFARQLGRGGYSDVFLYEQQLPRRQVAVKVLRVAGLTDALRRRFTAEADTMAGLAAHPNIVPVFSADIAADGRPYLTMLFCPRANLAERAAREPLGVPEVLRVGVQIGGAIETAHRANVLHRDIKPANVLIDQYDVPRLADFGIAGELAAGEDDPDLGVSIHFSPPEILYGTARPSVASDVYSFGATLWTLLVGRPPFSVSRHDSTAEVMERVRATAPRPTGRPDVPASFERLLAQALAKNPAVRPRSALDLVHALQQIEQELQLPVTRVFVETPEVAPTRSAGGDNETRARAPRVTGPVREVPSGSRASSAWAPPARPSGSASPPPPAPPIPPADRDATVRRAASAGASTAGASAPGPRGSGEETVSRAPQLPTATGAPRGRRGVHRGVVVGAGVVVAAAAVVVGLLIAGSGGGATPRPASTVPVGQQSAADQDPAGDVIPVGPVTVTAGPVTAGRVRFTWTYDGELGSDSFLWQTTTGGRSGTSTTPSVELPVAAGARTCVEVKVVRADGSNAAVAWSTAGCSM